MARDPELIEHLRGVPLFEGLRDRELRAIASKARKVEHTDGKEIVLEGTESAGLHLILDGHAIVRVHGDERRRLNPGEYFGEISLIDGRARSASVIADGPVRTLSLPAWEFWPLVDEHPRIAHPMLKVLCGRLREAEESA